MSLVLLKETFWENADLILFYYAYHIINFPSNIPQHQFFLKHGLLLDLLAMPVTPRGPQGVAERLQHTRKGTTITIQCRFTNIPSVVHMLFCYERKSCEAAPFVYCITHLGHSLCLKLNWCFWLAMNGKAAKLHLAFIA